MQRQSLRVIFAVSLVTLVAVAAVFFIVTEPSSVGDASSIEASLSGPALPTTSTSEPEPAASPPATVDAVDPSSPSVPIRPGELKETAVDDPVVPVALELSSIGIDAPVIPMGVNQRTGQMAVPNNVRDVAWYEFGSRPGESGSAVLAAHVDLASQGPGVFFGLRKVEVGDIVKVTFSDDSVSRFRVEARTVYRKAELPLDTIFAREGAPVLTLITCGGGFSESSGSYDSNVVVYAVPVQDRDLGSAG
jgi:LPXTG-site transpeptidase (sortase) family protein